MPIQQKNMIWDNATRSFKIGIIVYGYVFLILLFFSLSSLNSDFYIYVPFYIISLYAIIDNLKWLIVFNNGKRNITYCNYVVCQRIKKNGIFDQLSDKFESVTTLRNYGLHSILFKTFYYSLNNNPKIRILVLVTNQKIITFITSSCIHDTERLSQILQEIRNY